MKEFLEEIKKDIKWEEEVQNDPDASHWGMQEGVITSINDMKRLLRGLHLQEPVLLDIGLKKVWAYRVLCPSMIPDPNQEDYLLYFRYPYSFKDQYHVSQKKNNEFFHKRVAKEGNFSIRELDIHIAYLEPPYLITEDE